MRGHQLKSMKPSLSIFVCITALIALVLGVGAFAGATTPSWTSPDPTTIAPQKNIELPLNVGSTAQSKSGSLLLKSLQFSPGTAFPSWILTADDDKGKVKWSKPNFLSYDLNNCAIEYFSATAKNPSDHPILLVKPGRGNICTGKNGCEIRMWIQDTDLTLPSAQYRAMMPSSYYHENSAGQFIARSDDAASRIITGMHGISSDVVIWDGIMTIGGMVDWCTLYAQKSGTDTYGSKNFFVLKRDMTVARPYTCGIKICESIN